MVLLERYYTGKNGRQMAYSDLFCYNPKSPLQPHVAVCLYTNARELRAVIEENKDNVNWCSGSWGTPLHVAVACDFVEAVEILLDAGADDLVQRGLQKDDTAWMLAAKLGRREILRRFWSRIPEPPGTLNPNLRPVGTHFDTDSKVVCLCDAARHGQAAMVRDMLDWKQDWDMDSLSSAVVAAAAEWQDEVVALFLSRFTFPTEKLNVFLRAACALKPMRMGGYETEDYLGFDGVRQERQVASIMRAGAEFEVPRAWSPTKLGLVHFTASIAFLIGALKGLLDNGADPNLPDPVHGMTALHGLAWPARQGELGPYTDRHNYTAARLLLEHGADVFRPDNRGNTPLHYAAAGADMHLLSTYASAAGLSVTEMVAGRRNHVGETVLHWAAVGGKADILEYLLSRDSQDADDGDSGSSISSLNLPNNHGWTPLMCAAVGDGHHTRTARDAVRAVEVLLDHGADPNVTTADGLNILHALSRHLDTDPDSVLGRVTERVLRSMSRAEEKIQARAIPHADIGRRWQVLSPFHGEKCFKGCWSPRNDPWTRYQHDDGVNAHEAGSPLHWAARHGGLGVARALLAAGADYRAKDEGGDMCVQLAYKARGKLPDEAVHGFIRLIREQNLEGGSMEETPEEA